MVVARGQARRKYRRAHLCKLRLRALCEAKSNGNISLQRKDIQPE